MPITFRCACGMQLRVKDEAAGKTCVCPNCGAKSAIPAAVETVTDSRPVRASTASPAPPPPSTVDHPGPDAAAIQPRPPKPEPPPRMRRVWPWAAAAAVLLLGLGALGLWLLLHRTEQPPAPPGPGGPTAASDLDLIPADADSFVTIRLGDWWGSPAGKKLQQQFAPLGPNDLIEQALGTPPDAIQRASFVVLGDQTPWIIRTRTPAPRDRVLARLAPNAAVGEEGGRTLYLVGDRAVCFISDQVYLFGTPAGLRRLLAAPAGPRPAGPIADALGLTDKHLLTTALNPEGADIRQMKQRLDPGRVKEFAALLEARRYTLTIDFEDDLKLHWTLLLPDAETAAAALEQMRSLIKQARSALQTAREAIAVQYRQAAEPALVLFDALLRSANLEQRQAALEIDLQVEKELLTAQVALLAPAVQKVRDAAARVIEKNNLLMLGIGMHSHHDQIGVLPAPAICGPDGKPLLSWRVALLPYLEQEDLYREFHLDEPWDSPHNKPLLAKMPKLFQSPTATADPPFTTHYRVFTGDQAAFPALSNRPGPLSRGRRLTDFTDGTANTLLIVVAAEAVPWTKPDELPYTPQGPLPRLGVQEEGFAAAFADGTVRFLPGKLDEKTLRALITPAGGEVVELPP
jgi:hypothetical protein